MHRACKRAWAHGTRRVDRADGTVNRLHFGSPHGMEHYTPRPPPQAGGADRVKRSRQLSHGTAATADSEGVQWKEQQLETLPGPAVVWLDLSSASLATGVATEIDATHDGLRRAGVEIAPFADLDSALSWGVHNVLRIVCVCIQLEPKHLLRKSETVVQLLRQFKGLGIPVLAVQLAKRTEALRASEQICQSEGVPVLRDAASSMQRVMELVATSYAFVDGRLQRVIGTGTDDDDAVRPTERVATSEPQLPPGAMPFDSLVYEGPVYPPAFVALSKGRATGTVVNDAPAKRGKVPIRLVVDPAQADRVAECQRCKTLSDRLRAAQCEVDAHRLRLKHVVLASHRDLEEAPVGSAASWDRQRGKQRGGRASSWLRKGERERMENSLKDKDAEIEALKAKLHMLAAVAQSKANLSQERDWLAEQMSQQAMSASERETKQLDEARMDNATLMVQIQQHNYELKTAAQRLEKEQRATAKVRLLVKKQESHIAELQAAAAADAQRQQSHLKLVEENVDLASRLADAEEKAETLDATALQLREALRVEAATVMKLYGLMLTHCAVDSDSITAHAAYVESLAKMSESELRVAGDQWTAPQLRDSIPQDTTLPGTSLEIIRSQVKRHYLVVNAQEALEKARSKPSAGANPQPELGAESEEEQYIKMDGKWVRRDQQSLSGTRTLESNGKVDLELQAQTGSSTSNIKRPADTGHDDGGKDNFSVEDSESCGDTDLLSLGVVLKVRSGVAAWLAEARAQKAQNLAESLLLESQQMGEASELQEGYRDAVRTRMRRVTTIFVPSKPAELSAVQNKDCSSEADGEATSSWLTDASMQASELAAYLISQEGD